MMISPLTFIELKCKGKKYGELLKIRDEIIDEMYAFEEGELPEEDWMMLPSPKTRYHWNLECLGELCKLILETYINEATDKDDEEQ